jgi:hypothetical protein
MLDINKRYARHIFLATHCFGEKAQAALQKIKTKYKDIVDEHLEIVAPPKTYTTESGYEITKYGNYVFLLMIVTDDADKFASAIDTFIAQFKGKGLIGHTMVLDLHYSSHAAEYVKRWERYNVVSAEYDSIEDSLQSLILFIEENLDVHGLISFDWNDFKWMLPLSVHLSCGTILPKAGHPLAESFPIPVERVKGLILGLELSSLNEEISLKETNDLNDFIECFPEDLECKWSIPVKLGESKVRYIAMI